MNKNESKYFNTAILFDEALLYLLEKKDIEYITVSEICTKAGVNRSTFYVHYESINDLIEETLDYINKKFNEYFNENQEEFINRINILSLEELNFINEKYLITFYINGIMGIVKEWINNDCEDSIKDIENIIIKCINRN